MPVIQKQTKGSYFVTIPKDIVKLYGWEQGTNVEFFEERPGVMAIRKVR